MNEPPPTLIKLRRKADFWVATAGVSFVLAFAGNFVPDGWTTIPGVAVIIWVPAFLIAWHSYRKFGLESRKLEALTRAKPEIPIPARPQLSSSEHGTTSAKNEGLALPWAELQGQSPDSDKPPVLYLRPFDKDKVTATLAGAFTEEESLTQLLSYFGPVIAIGRPGEKLPEVGARRLYVNDTEWQSTVEGLMKRARLVVIRTGRSGGLRWEFRKCFELLSPEQLLLVVDSKVELNEMLKQIGKPSFRYVGWRSIGSTRAFVIFRENWKPALLRMRGTRFWVTEQVGPAFYGTYIQPRLVRTLRPLFEQFGVRWPKPTIGYLNVMFSLFIISVFVLTILEVVVGDSEVQNFFRRLRGMFRADPALIMVFGLLLLSLIVLLVAKIWRKYMGEGS